MLEYENCDDFQMTLKVKLVFRTMARHCDWYLYCTCIAFTCIASCTCTPGVPERRSRGRGRVVVDRQSQLAVRHRPRQLCRRLHGGNDGSRDRRSDDVTRRPPRLRLRRHLAPRLPAQTRYPVCGEDAAGRRGPSDRVHQGIYGLLRQD